MDPRPGDVHVLDLGIAGKVRAGIVLSRFDPDRPLAQVIVASITTKCRDSRYEVSLGKPSFLREESWVNVQSAAAIDPHKLGKRIGKLTEEQMAKIKKALAYLFDF
jgi:mRNA interferase MazF